MSTKSNFSKRKKARLAHNTIDEEFNAKMTALNDFCLQHPDMDLYDMEFCMSHLLHNWMYRIQIGSTHNSANFRKWAEIVSRWDPIYWYADEASNAPFMPTQLRHVEELPDDDE